MFYVDGNSTEKIKGYATWRVINERGAVLASMHGPMSFVAAKAFCAALRSDNVPNISGDDYSNDTVVVQELSC
jgi:hypothetical protein